MAGDRDCGTMTTAFIFMTAAFVFMCAYVVFKEL